MDISRELYSQVRKLFNPSTQKQGLILSGVVGSGKTTLVHKLVKELQDDFECFEFTGDDLEFRVNVLNDTKYIYKRIHEKTKKKSFVFIDEIQKTEEAFDAIKYAYDHLDCSFVVSGSNPDYLNTVAKKRLQRRAHFLVLRPFSLPEILAHQKLIGMDVVAQFRELMAHPSSMKDFEDCAQQVKHLDLRIKVQVDEYLKYGGIPRVFLATDPKLKLMEIQNVAERGLESLSSGNSNLEDVIRVELGKLNSQEFAYQGIFQKTRISKRALVNQVIDQLINHGYLLRKKPILFHNSKTTYLNIFSFIDPGLVTYFSGLKEDASGFRVESVVHSRLDSLKNEMIVKFDLGYYKPYTIDVNEKVKYSTGEIGFVLLSGNSILPMEVKRSFSSQGFDLSILKNFQKQKKTPYGLVFYGGLPRIDYDEKLIFWPYWLV